MYLKLINQGLKRHKKTCKGLTKPMEYQECGQQFNSTNEFNMHINKKTDWSQ